MERVGRVRVRRRGVVLGGLLLVTAVVATGIALRSAADTPLVVAAVGDIACSAKERPEESGCQHEATAEVVASLEPDLVLALGDLQYPSGGSEDFRSSYDRSWGVFKEITRPVLGNHETQDPGAKGYFEYFGEAAGDPSQGYYSFDAGEWHIVALNSECGDEGCLEQGSDQENWLRQDLARSNAACTLAFWHRPRFSSDEKRGNDGSTRYLWRALQEAGADLVLAAHAHTYERFAPADSEGRPHDSGLRSFVVGTGGKSLYEMGARQPHSEAAQDDTFGVLRLSLHPTSYEWEFVPIDGEDFEDAGNASCNDRR